MYLSLEHLTAGGNGMVAAKINGRLRRKRNRPARQEALMRAATKLFATRGYEATTTREIAAAAGCAEGLIHRYFKGKAGLLLSLMSFYAGREVNDLHDDLPVGRTLEDEILQVMAWEVERMWRDRDMLRVSVPRAILDAKVGKFVNHVGPQRHANAIAQRLRRHQQGRALKNSDIQALSNAICALGFIFGFLRPAVLGYDRKEARKVAMDVARIFARGIQRAGEAHRPRLH
jgi:TetR/AcrR family transcriptional regulator, cholesterol catabolism regulator